MNKLAKKMANREGFTLVELIVVIAILGILAGIAIPVYSGYIKKANEAADLQALDAIKTAVVFAATENDPDHELTIATMTVEPNKQTVAITGTGIADGVSPVDVSDYTTVPTTFKTGATKYEWSSDTQEWTPTLPTT